MHIYHTICYKRFAYSVRRYYSFFYNEPDLCEDFFCRCLQQAIIVTLFSQNGLPYVRRSRSSRQLSHPSQWGNDKNNWFFLKLSALKVRNCAKAYISSTNSAWRCVIWCLYDATSSVCTVKCKEKSVSVLKHDKMAREWRQSCAHYRDTAWGTMVVFNMRWLNLDSYERAVWMCARTYPFALCL